MFLSFYNGLYYAFAWYRKKNEKNHFYAKHHAIRFFKAFVLALKNINGFV